MTTIETDDGGKICVNWEPDGRIKIERIDETSGTAMWFEASDARMMAMVIVGMTSISKRDVDAPPES